MDVLMNGLLLAASLFAGGYCWVLSRRVNELKSLDRGLGGAIVTLTRQIELARGTLDEARAATRENRHDLTQLIGRADTAAAQLKLVLATATELEARLPAVRGPSLRPTPVQVIPEAATGRTTEAARAASSVSRAGTESPGASRSEPKLAATVDGAPAPRSEPRTDEKIEPRLETVGRVSMDDIVPKPRTLPPFETPLRPRLEPEAPRNEADLMQALTAFAAGVRS